MATEAPPPYSDFSSQAPYSQPTEPEKKPPPSVSYPANQYQGYVPPQQPGYTTVITAQPVGVLSSGQVKPENYLFLSIFSIFCCCFPFGIIALIYSLQVDSSWNIGDYQSASRNSQAARKWNIASIVGGIISTVVVVAIVVVANVATRLAFA